MVIGISDYIGVEAGGYSKLGSARSDAAARARLRLGRNNDGRPTALQRLRQLRRRRHLRAAVLEKPPVDRIARDAIAKQAHAATSAQTPPRD